ncbi:DUF2267 domain-containing protein [Saccharopolyspora sp. CA-218241]|uniref:DUF2267 domain-containing protein n=1 Tax=Saccharopolyspora sp. CA-218241 TaxID=3240027 RepID=UPI003D955F78
MPVQYQQFVEGVRERAELGSAADAREATVHTLEALARHLDTVDRQQLATVVPGAIRESVHWDVAVDQEQDVIAETARELGRPPEQARYVVQAVLSEIAAEDDALTASLEHRLPDELAPLFAAPGQGPPPEWSAAAAEPRPRPLDQDELARTLAEMPGWTGTTERIERTASLPPERWKPVFNRIDAAQQELSHHATIDDHGDGTVSFALSTRSLGAVTELDLQLARRIDDAIADIGSGG